MAVRSRPFASRAVEGHGEDRQLTFECGDESPWLERTDGIVATAGPLGKDDHETASPEPRGSLADGLETLETTSTVENCHPRRFQIPTEEGDRRQLLLDDKAQIHRQSHQHHLLLLQ